MKLENFSPCSGEHCETTTLRNMLAHEGLVMSEAMLFGLSEGLDFQYWSGPQPRSLMPILSGRIKSGAITSNLGKNLQLDIVEQLAQTPQIAFEQAQEILTNGHVAGLKLDIYYLDYFASQRHFCAHYIALSELDQDYAHVIDTTQQGGEHTLPSSSLAKARNSQEGFMFSRNLSIYINHIPTQSWAYETQNNAKRASSGAVTNTLLNAIKNTATHYLSHRGELCGATGIRFCAQAMKDEYDMYEEPQKMATDIGNFLRYAGTGGANFRHLYHLFLVECLEYFEHPLLHQCINDFATNIIEWDAVINKLLLYGAKGKKLDLIQASEHFFLVAELEQQCMSSLLQMVEQISQSEASHGDEQTQVKSICRMCHGGCGAIVTLEGGKPVSIRGDSSNPISEGYFCAKGKASIELLNNPDRLQQPLKKVVDVDGVHFEPISWDEALDTISTKMTAIMAANGKESIALAQGTDRNYQEWVFRFANALGTPNVTGPAHVCFYPRVMASIMTYGGFTFSDYDGEPQTIMLWGSNKLHTHSDGVIGIKLAKAIKQGAQLIVIDPYETTAARQATCWLQIQPGSDGALALGMLNLIITNKWYEESFVQQYTSGFDELKQHVKKYDLVTVAKLTGLSQSAIYQASELYALSNSATIEAGTGISQNINAFDTLRSIAMLSALSGNLDAKGGDLLWPTMAVDGRRSFPKTQILSKQQADKRLGSDKHRILAMSGWVSPDSLWESIIDNHPYPTKALLIFGSNVLVSHANTSRVEQALEALDFLVVSDMFMTPTAKMADIILPVSSWLERDQIVEFNSYIAPRQKMAQVGLCKSDEQIIIELAERLGLSEHFWPSIEAALDHKLSGMGIDWQTFTQQGVILNDKRYHKYVEQGFNTRNNKINLYHAGLQHMGYPPAPEYMPIEHISPLDEKFPYRLTSAHSRYFYNSEYHQLHCIHKRQSYPFLTLHPDTAKREGMIQNEVVSVYSRQNQAGILFHINISDKIDPKVIYVDPCWWYPQEMKNKLALRSSINQLTNAQNVNPQMGSNNLRAFAVGLSKVNQDNKWLNEFPDCEYLFSMRTEEIEQVNGRNNTADEENEYAN